MSLPVDFFISSIQIGMHAAGVIICRDPIAEHVPLARTNEDVVAMISSSLVGCNSRIKPFMPPDSSWNTASVSPLPISS